MGGKWTWERFSWRALMTQNTSICPKCTPQIKAVGRWPTENTTLQSPLRLSELQTCGFQLN